MSQIHVPKDCFEETGWDVERIDRVAATLAVIGCQMLAPRLRLLLFLCEIERNTPKRGEFLSEVIRHEYSGRN